MWTSISFSKIHLNLPGIAFNQQLIHFLYDLVKYLGLYIDSKLKKVFNCLKSSMFDCSHVHKAKDAGYMAMFSWCWNILHAVVRGACYRGHQTVEGYPRLGSFMVLCQPLEADRFFMDNLIMWMPLLNFHIIQAKNQFKCTFLCLISFATRSH